MAYRRFYEVDFSESQVKLANVELLTSSTLILLLKLMTLLVFLTQKISKNIVQVPDSSEPSKNIVPFI